MINQFDCNISHMIEHLKEYSGMQKNHSIFYIKSRDNGVSIVIFCNDLTLELYKIKTNEAISKIQASTDPL